MNILLIGGAGFLGLNLSQALLDRGHTVHLADRHFPAHDHGRTLPRVASQHQLVSSAVDATLELVDALKVNCVFNLASALIPSSSFEEFSEEMTTVMTPGFRLVNALAERRIKYVYFSSGGTIYGSSTKLSLNEAEPLRPISHYGCSKLLFEQYIQFASRTRGLQYLILRPSNPFGPFQNPNKKQGLVAVAADKILHRQPIEIWGDGSIVRDYIWVEDLAHAVAELIELELSWNETLNIGSGIGHSVNDIIAAIEALSGIKARVSYQPARAVDVPRIVLDISKLSSLINFDVTPLRTAIDTYLREVTR